MSCEDPHPRIAVEADVIDYWLTSVGCLHSSLTIFHSAMEAFVAQAKKALQEQARMLFEAKTAILNSGDFLPATAIIRVFGPSQISRTYRRR